MTREEFEQLVRRLEVGARGNPSSYRRRVIALAFAGYAYLGLVVAGLLALLVLAILSITYLKVLGIKIAFAIGVFLWFVVRALWVRIEPPAGIRVDERSAPELVAMVERLRRALKAPRFHNIVIDDAFNAAVVQVPRLGIFGWHSNYLVIGLPMMKVLTPQQLEAVIAHELGHLAGGHARVSNWIYRLRLGWNHLRHALEERRSRAMFLFKPFFEHYAPYFLAYSFPLARADEYEADAAAARLTSPRSVAAALSTTEVMGAYIDKRFWPSVHGRVAELPRPSFRPTLVLDQHLAEGVAPEDEKEWLERAVARPSTVDDTHPALSERLAAIGEGPVVEHAAPGKGADRLLGASLGDIARRLDEQWANDIGPAWERRHGELSRDRARLAELRAAKREGAPMDGDALVELASLTEAHGEGKSAALGLFREAHSLHPDHPWANYALGIRLLRADDDAGIALLERAMQLDSSAVVPGCEALRDYAWRRGRTEEAKQWHARWSEAAKLADAVQEERARITLSDKLERHALEPAALERLRKQLAAVGVRKAWIARKRLKHDADRPLYLLGIRSTPMWMWTRKKRMEAVVRAVYERVELPGETIVVSLEGEHHRFASKFRWKRARVL